METLKIESSFLPSDGLQRFVEATLDALDAHIAILDDEGTILFVNAGWREFADLNQLAYENHGVGRNYLAVCESASGDWSEGAREVANGIRQLMSEELDLFTMEYPCHGPNIEHWFGVRITRFDSDSSIRIVVQHEEITDRRQVEEALQERSHQLTERVKELNCLYSISKLSERADFTLEEAIQSIVTLIPVGWQYPEITAARVIIKNQEFLSEVFSESPWQQMSSIFAFGHQVGQLQVFYLKEKPAQDEGPFLKEERYLIAAISEHLGNIIERKQFEENLRDSETQYRALFEGAADAIFLMQGDRFLDCNSSALSIFACTREQIIKHSLIHFSPEYQPDGSDSKEKALEYIQATLDGEPQRFEWTHLKADDTPFEAEVRLKRINLRAQPHILASVRDISERKKIENERILNESRLSALLELSQKAHELSERDIVQHALEEAVRLTGSHIGYLHFVNPDQNTIQLVTWSEKTYEYCSIVYESHYPLEQAGIWADCVRIGKPVFHNDYPNLPDKKGYPQGHADLIRHASIPIFDEGKIVIILGVGNKEQDYDATDVLQMVLIGDQLVRILQRKRFENDLRIKDSAIASAINAVAITNLKGSLDYVNAAFLKMWGYKNDSEVLGRPATDFWSYLDKTNEVITTLQNQASWMGEVVGLREEAIPFDAQLSASLVRNEAGEPVSVMNSFIDITERKHAERDLRNANLLLENRLVEIEELQNKLREQAIRDPLTGLFNRRYLEENLIQAVARANRYRYSISLVMIDIDHFKVVNDTYGHKAGDQMLIALSELLRNQTRKGDTICRYGGEEFVVMMPRASREIAAHRANQWRQAFEELQVPFDGISLNTTLSAGIATIPPDIKDAQSAMREADIALYRSKAEGRNRITISDKFRG